MSCCNAMLLALLDESIEEFNEKYYLPTHRHEDGESIDLPPKQLYFCLFCGMALTFPDLIQAQFE